MTDNDRLHELLHLASEVAQPQLTEPALHERFGVPDEWPLRPGAVWRARWDDVALLVLLVETPTVSAVNVAPVTFDSTAPDSDTLVASAPAARGLPVTVWRALRCDIPLAVLDRPIDEMPQDLVSWVTGGAVPDGSTLGAPALPFAPTSGVRAGLQNDLDALVQAVPDLEVAARPAPVQRERISPTDEQYAALVDRLGMALPAVLDLVDGKRQPSEEESAALRELLGVIPDVEPTPVELVLEMNYPRWKRTVLDLAERDGLREAAARMAMANGVLALAARQTGAHAPDWRERLARWAAAEGLTRS
jgi:hypothetical protein